MPPVHPEDRMVEMVSVTDNTMVAPDEVTNMLVDNDSIAEEIRRSHLETKEHTQGSRRGITEIT